MNDADDRQVSSDDQRAFVVMDLKRFVHVARVDLEPDGSWAEKARHDAEVGTRALELLMGGQPAAADVLLFLEARLEAVEEEIDYRQLLRNLFERDAYAAVISGLR